ncbi:hypothetical protein F170042I7_21300 [Blautia caecimuris]|uniref:helix-turn-helix domain-containing protein n=1 Tax=Blautia caecimuris TaxID=1796615 RepID=UPI0034B52216
MTIKDQISACCDVAGMTVTELGAKMGMSQQNISKRLKTGKFTKSELEQMAEILGAKYHSIFIFPDDTMIK